MVSICGGSRWVVVGSGWPMVAGDVAVLAAVGGTGAGGEGGSRRTPLPPEMTPFTVRRQKFGFSRLGA